MADSPIEETRILPSGILLAILSPLVFVLNVPPLIWHIRNRNTSAIILVAWLLLLNFLNTLNILIWPYISYSSLWLGPGLCDIEVKLMAAKTTGIPAALLCLVKALAKVLDTEKTLLGPTKAQRRRLLCGELAWCVGFPLATMVAHYLVQYNRYIVFGVSGCQATFVRNIPALFLLSLPPLLLNIYAAYFALLVLVRLRRYRHTFAQILASSSTSTSRFLRLFAIAALLLLGSLPLQFYVLLTNLPVAGSPVSFSAIHGSGAWDVVLVGGSRVVYDRWISVAVGICVFALFGVGKDALGMYRGWLVRGGLSGARRWPWLRVDGTAGGGTGPLCGGSKASGWSRSAASTLASVDAADGAEPSFGADVEGAAAARDQTSEPTRPQQLGSGRGDRSRWPRIPVSNSGGSRFELPLYYRARCEGESEEAELRSQSPLYDYTPPQQKSGGVPVGKEIERESSGF